MIAIIDYGVGNLFSLCSSLKFLGYEALITGNKDEIRKADKIILPGVGAFGEAMEKLEKSGLLEIVKEEANNNKPILGICLGMQMLFEKSYEYGEHNGLSLIKGEIIPFKDKISSDLKIPQIGWNSIKKEKDCEILKYVNDDDFVYFVHSYFAPFSKEYTAASSEYGTKFCAVAMNKNVFGCQFHPEKSGKIGLSILKAFCEIGE